jgi:hypothetical protein
MLILINRLYQVEWMLLALSCHQEEVEVEHLDAGAIARAEVSRGAGG